MIRVIKRGLEHRASACLPAVTAQLVEHAGVHKVGDDGRTRYDRHFVGTSRRTSEAVVGTYTRVIGAAHRRFHRESSELSWVRLGGASQMISWRRLHKGHVFGFVTDSEDLTLLDDGWLILRRTEGYGACRAIHVCSTLRESA